ncbi:MAG: tetratricopeptide repeat protein [Armatimonadetes bacterium]|nr:tetratricopeptide repeat protein [Armatimonadota bacterium]
MADSKFCRECGVALTPLPNNVLREENVKMVSDAQRLFGDGRYEEATLISTAILENDPDCVEALALRGDCHERLGEYELAVACYRQILEIQPDSQLDRIRVARLEKLVVSDELEVGEPRHGRRTALWAAIAAAVLLVSSGSALILASSATDAEYSSRSSDPNAARSTPFIPVPPIPGSRSYVPLQNQSPPGDADLEGLAGTESGGRTAPEMSTSTADRSARVIPGGVSGLREPTVPSVIDPNKFTNRPLRIEPGALLGGTRAIDDPDPDVVGNDAESDDPGSRMIVEVNASERVDPTAGSQTVQDRAAEAETLIRVARNHFIVGDFAKAADAWEKALEAGASPASTNQRLAQCYEKLGRKADAIAAYKRSIQEYEKLDQTDELVKSALDACRQALKVLEGN